MCVSLIAEAATRQAEMPGSPIDFDAFDPFSATEAVIAEMMADPAYWEWRAEDARESLVSPGEAAAIEAASLYMADHAARGEDVVGSWDGVPY